MSKKGRKQVSRAKNERLLQKSGIKQRNISKTSEALKASEVFCCACGGGVTRRRGGVV